MPLLLRAEAFRHMKRYADAWALTEQHLARCPDNNPRWARLLQVQLLLNQGLADKANAIMDEVLKKYPDDNCYLCPVRIGLLKLQIASARHDDRSVYETLKRKRHAMTDGLDTRDYPRLLELMMKFEGPEKTLQIIDGLPESDQLYWGYYAKLPLTRAKCLASLGRKREAAEICSHLKASALERKVFGMVPTFKEDRDFHSELLAVLQNLETEVGSDYDTWVKASSVRPFPKDMKFYVFQIGEDSVGVTPRAAEIVGDFLGTEVEVRQSGSQKQTFLPVFDPGIRAESPNLKVFRDTCNRNTLNALRNAIKHTELPANCVFLAFATTIEGCWLKDFALSENRGNPCLLNGLLFSDLFDSRPKKKEILARRLAKVMLWTFYHSYSAQSTGKAFPRGAPSCPHYPCIFGPWSQQWEGSVRDSLIFAMCPDCQAQYKKVDFNKVQQAVQKYMKSAKQ